MKYCPKCSQTFPREQRFCLEDGTILSLRDPYNLVGRTLGGRYRIDALIGVGGMGAVYNAFQLGPDRRVAFKILQPNLTLQNDQILRLFEGEAKMVGGLSHENIVIIYDAGRAEDSLAFIAMEWLEGQTLEEHIAASSPLGLDRVANLLKQFSGALETAHRMHIIHRDLKPTNVILARQVDGSERLKVLDFGIAKALGDATDAPVSQIIGTPHYASPEQLQVGEMIDTRSDIYSLGIILYRMITGRLPFVASSIRELIDLHLTAPPPPLRDLRPDLPSAIDKLILQMLDKDAARRPRTIREVNDSFQRALVARAKSASASVPSRSSRRAKQLLLWVDDQPQHNRALIERLRVSGWEIIETRSTAEALEALASVDGPFEMIISDMGRTEDGTFRPYAGLELIEAAHAADYALPIVIFSSPGRVKEMRERVSAAGGYGVTASADELFEMLNRRLEMRSGERVIQPQVTVAPAFFPDLQIGSFEVIALSATGEVIERRPSEASYYVEDLGANISLDLVKIPAGSYLMGSEESEKSRYFLETPQHQVSIQSFYMSRHPVTQEQWRRVAGFPKAAVELNPSPSYFKGARRPVERISWEEAMEFCKRLSLATGRPYRLPSESEWEYACRAGTTTPFHFGETITPEWVNYNGGHPYGEGPQGIFRGETVEVGSLGGANAFGLYEMHGNVWDWCADPWHDDYLGAPADGGIWEVGGDVRLRVIRGGAFQYFATVCRSAYRFQNPFDRRINNLGLRLVASIPRYNRAIGDSRSGQ